MNVKAEAELMITSFVWNAAAQLRRQENLESHLYAKFGRAQVRFLFGKSARTLRNNLAAQTKDDNEIRFDFY